MFLVGQQAGDSAEDPGTDQQPIYFWRDTPGKGNWIKWILHILRQGKIRE